MGWGRMGWAGRGREGVDRRVRGLSGRVGGQEEGVKRVGCGGGLCCTAVIERIKTRTGLSGNNLMFDFAVVDSSS